MSERAGIINGEKKKDGLQGRLCEKGKLHDGNRGGCKVRMEISKMKAEVGRYRCGHTSGSRGAGGDAGGVTDGKAAEGLDRSGGAERKEDAVEQKSFRTWAFTEPQPRQRG